MSGRIESSISGAGALARLLNTDQGVRHGDRVAFLGYNNPAMVALLFACAQLGAILVPLNWRLTAAELSFIVEDCAPRVVFFEPDFAEVAERLSAHAQTAAATELDNAKSGDAFVAEGRVSPIRF